jgi:hypothetical protein
MRLTNLFLSLTVMTVALVAQDIKLPDGNVVQGGASPAGQRLPPPPPPPALPGTASTAGADTGTQVESAAPIQTATEGDDTVQKATAAMKLMGADPAKDRELFEKLVATIRANRKSAEGAATQVQAGAQGASLPQDAGAEAAPKSGSSTSSQVRQIQPVQGAQQQVVAGGSQLVQGSTGYDSSYSSCNACTTTYVPTCTTYVVPTYVTYPRYYVSSCSYPVFRSYPTVSFRGFASFGGHRVLRAR